MVAYDSYEIGPVLRDIRTKNNMTIEYVANQTRAFSINDMPD